MSECLNDPFSKSFKPEKIEGDFNFILVRVNDIPSKPYIAWFLRIDTKERLYSYMSAFGVFLSKKYFDAKEKIDNKSHIDSIQHAMHKEIEFADNDGIKRHSAFDDLMIITKRFSKSIIDEFCKGKIIIVNKNCGWRFLDDDMEIIKDVQKNYLDFPIGEESGLGNYEISRKGYDINNSDEFKLHTGYISPDGKWYSCFEMEHDPFAQDYINKYHYTMNPKKETMLDELGWISVSQVTLGLFIQVGKKSITTAQRLTLKKWFKVYRVPFKIQGFVEKDDWGEISNEYDSFFEV